MAVQDLGLRINNKRQSYSKTTNKSKNTFCRCWRRYVWNLDIDQCNHVTNQSVKRTKDVSQLMPLVRHQARECRHKKRVSATLTARPQAYWRAGVLTINLYLRCQWSWNTNLRFDAIPRHFSIKQRPPVSKQTLTPGYSCGLVFLSLY